MAEGKIMNSNEVLKKYDYLIIKGVKKVNIHPYFLKSRCITYDDIIQEVRIKIWKLIETTYKQEYDLENFILYQSSWNAYKIIRNLKRSSRGFTGTLSSVTTKSGSLQAKIDDNKIRFSDLRSLQDLPYNEDFHNVNDCFESELGCMEEDPANSKIIDNSYLNFGGEFDYNYLVDRILKKIEERYKSINYELPYLHDLESLKQTYIAVFIMLIEEPDLFSDSNVYSIIKQKIGYKSELGVKLIVDKIREIAKEVIDEYNKQ